MAIKASAAITLSCVVDVRSTTRYYLLRSSTQAAPAKPTANPPTGGWDDTEPSYTSGSTNSLYFTDLTVFSDGTWAYSSVSLSSAYEAAKAAWNKAQAAQTAVTTLDDALTQQEIFNRLTDNGAAQGLVLANGQLYVNASYINAGYLAANRIQGGTLTLGGESNGNGQMVVKDRSDATIVTANNDGLSINRGLITSYSDDGDYRASVTSGELALQNYRTGGDGEMGWQDDLSLSLGSSGKAYLTAHDELTLHSQNGDIHIRNDKAPNPDGCSMDMTYGGVMTLTGGQSSIEISTHRIKIDAGPVIASDGFVGNLNGNATNVTGTVAVAHGGTGATSLTSGAALIGNGTGAVTTRSITNNTSATAVTASTNLITANTLHYHKGNANIVTVGTITSGTWQGTAIAAAYIGNHSTDKLTSGTLPVTRGGTGQTSLKATRNAMGLGDTTGALPVANGGTGATTTAGALSNLGIKYKTVTVTTSARGNISLSLSASRYWVISAFPTTDNYSATVHVYSDGWMARVFNVGSTSYSVVANKSVTVRVAYIDFTSITF